MAKKSLPRRMFKGKEFVSLYKAEQSPKSLMKEMSGEHLDLLQNIEFALVQAHEADPEVDDRTLDAALTAAMGGAEPDAASPEMEVLTQLDAIRRLREDVSNELWQKALRVVHDSLRRHSDRKPRERNYLDFIRDYVQ